MNEDRKGSPIRPASLDDLAAQLLAATAGQQEELARIRYGLLLLTEAPGLDDEAIDSLRLAGAFIQQALNESTDDPGASLASAAEALEDVLMRFPQAEATGATADSACEDSAESATAEVAAAEAEEDASAEDSAAEAEEGPRLAADTDMAILQEYIVESLDHIVAAESALLALEVNPGDSEQINTVFRAFHTIKGTSGFLALDRIQQVAHLAENLLDKARSGQVMLTGGYADLSLRSCDALKFMIGALKGLQPGDAMSVPNDLDDLLEVLRDPAGTGTSEETAPETLRVGDILVAHGRVDRGALEEIERQPEDAEHRPLGERLVKAGKVRPEDVAHALRAQKQSAAAPAAAMENSVRVGTGKLDHLIDMVGELVIAQSMVSQDPDVCGGDKPRLSRSVSHATKIIRELQDLTMSLRMVPLKATFQKMARLVRELGRKSGKSVQFITEGEDTEIDRNMVESLNDPLVHMIRNAVDHGIESAERRAAEGKSAAGTVRLSACQTAGNVIIELTDDGKGLDREKIIAKAVDRGLIENGREMSDPDVFGLIFQAGFSTAEKVTDVSGRGVGMDVVKKGIESLRGRVDLTSRLGAGTTFTLRLPLTMAIADAMLLRVGGERYLLPTSSIERSFRPEAGAVTTVIGRGEVVQLRNELLPVYRLHRLFHVPQAATEPCEALLIVIEGEGRRCALMVDELLGQQQVVIKSLGQVFGQIKGAAGAAILGDGRVGLILDATGIIQLAHGQQSVAA